MTKSRESLNVALAVRCAHYKGRTVLVVGTTEPGTATAVAVTPPAHPRTVDSEKPWFRARGEGNVFLPWWGLRYEDRTRYMQGTRSRAAPQPASASRTQALACLASKLVPYFAFSAPITVPMDFGLRSARPATVSAMKAFTSASDAMAGR